MKIKIGFKIFLSFGLCVLILLILVGYNYYGLYHLGNLQHKGNIRAEDAVKAQQTRRIGYKLYRITANTLINLDLIEKNKEDWKNQKEETNTVLIYIKNAADTEDEKEWVKVIENKIEEMINVYEKEMLPLIENGGDEEQIKNLVNNIEKMNEELQVPLRKYSDSLDNEMKEGDESFDNTHKNIVIISIVAAIISLITASILGFIITRSISDPIKIITEGTIRFSVGDIELKGMNWDKIIKINTRTDELGDIGKAFAKLIEYQKEKVNVAKEIALGNLVQEVSISSENDQLGKALNEMILSLNDLVGQVNGAVELVSSGSNQVAQASQSLSQGASEQASSLEEITSSITEISSQAKQNTDNAMQANSLAKQSMENSNKGNIQMNELVNAMLQINKSADEIKRIVKVIDDIAFQTNLLALNANVEAARAGKYGKGFAVVAEEVRNLASRSAVSVKETTSMVEDAIKNIQNVNSLVETTAKQLKEITDSANKVADLVEEIATASKEQTEGLGQINSGLGQIDQVTQANTANAEESASASEELSGQAQQLKGLVSKFKLKIQKLDNILPDNMNPQLLKLIQDELKKEKKGAVHIDNLEKMNKEKKEKLDKKIDIIQPKKVIKLDDDDFGKF